MQFDMGFTVVSDVLSTVQSAEVNRAQGGHMAPKPKYHIDIEGTIHDWDEDTITVAQIRELGDLPSDVPLIVIDFKDNSEDELAEDAVITLKPGQGFAKKIGFKRG
jgi:hypothetical protein